MRNKTQARHRRLTQSPSHTKRGTGRRHLQGNPAKKKLMNGETEL